MLSAPLARALPWLCAAVLALFWAQAVWDMTHPPLYDSPWGPVAADAAQPPPGARLGPGTPPGAPGAPP